VPVVPVVNIARTLEQLGRDGLVRLAFTDEATATLETLDLKREAVLVLGSEGEGLRRLTREVAMSASGCRRQTPCPASTCQMRQLLRSMHGRWPSHEDDRAICN
jgi:hypothetical protein